MAVRLPSLVTQSSPLQGGCRNGHTQLRGLPVRHRAAAAGGPFRHATDAVFAASLDEVVAGTAPANYQDAEAYFAATFRRVGYVHCSTGRWAASAVAQRGVGPPRRWPAGRGDCVAAGDQPRRRQDPQPHRALPRSPGPTVAGACRRVHGSGAAYSSTASSTIETPNADRRIPPAPEKMWGRRSAGPVPRPRRTRRWCLRGADFGRVLRSGRSPLWRSAHGHL